LEVGNGAEFILKLLAWRYALRMDMKGEEALKKTP
jgi:hypothetical protein